MKLIALELSLVCDWKGLCCEVKSENIFFFQKVIYLLDFFLKFEFSILFPLVPRRLNDPVKYLDYVTKCMRKLNVELITIASKHKTKGREIQNL